MSAGKYTSMKDFDDEVERLGRGSFGLAMKVTDRRNPDLQFVVKKVDIEQQVEKGGSAKERQTIRNTIVNEARVMMKLSHDYIVKVHSYFEVMEHCRNGSLHDAILERQQEKDRLGYFKEEQVSNWLSQLAIALLYLHDRNILHRDVKAENIFMMGDDVLKLGDFGVAKELNRNSAYFAKSWAGTVSHMSPEALKGEPYSFKHETWALGIVAYEMTRLCLPFGMDGLRSPACITGILNGIITPLPSHYSKPLCELILEKMLVRDVDARASIDQVVEHPALKMQIRRIVTKSKVKKAQELEDWRTDVCRQMAKFKHLLEQKDEEVVRYKRISEDLQQQLGKEATERNRQMEKLQNRLEQQSVELSNVSKENKRQLELMEALKCQNVVLQRKYQESHLKSADNNRRLEIIQKELEAKSKEIKEVKDFVMRTRTEKNAWHSMNHEPKNSDISEKIQDNLDKELYDAARSRNFNKTVRVIGMGAVNDGFRDATWSETALHRAAYTGEVSILAEIAKIPTTDVNCRNKHNATPLYYAAQNGHLEAVRYLVSHGAKTNIRIIRPNSLYNYKSPLGVALKENCIEVVDYLRSIGAEE